MWHCFDLWQYCACCIRSGVIQWPDAPSLWCSTGAVCGSPTVWVKSGALVTLGILMHFLAAEPQIQPQSTAGPLFPSQCPLGTILLTLYLMVWDWWVSKAGPMLFHRHKLPYKFWSSTIFPILSFLSIGWHCGAGVFGLIGCRLLTQSLALQTSFNNNHSNNKNNYNNIGVSRKKKVGMK